MEIQVFVVFWVMTL